ncbi:MAG: hypothetical protein WA364_16475 [Candidatus Nitrosopolaris sp.]
MIIQDEYFLSRQLLLIQRRRSFKSTYRTLAAMSEITTCCRSMEQMLIDGTIIPFTAFGHETGHMHVRGRDDRIFDYTDVTHCPFCGRQITIRRNPSP